jgi:hypothetical protein
MQLLGSVRRSHISASPVPLIRKMQRLGSQPAVTATEVGSLLWEYS